VAVLYLLGPGLLIGAAVRLRGLFLLGVAAPLSVTASSVSAVVASKLGIGWGPWVPFVAAALAALPLAVLRWRSGGRHTRAPGPVGEWGRTFGAAIAGAAAGGAAVAVVLRSAIHSPGQISQAYDIVYHLNAVKYIIAQADASSLRVGGVANTVTNTGFYPAAWHGITALVTELSGASIPVSANAMSVVISAVVWPLGCVFLARQIFGPRPAVLLFAGLLSAAFPATPYMLLDWGVLYPNGLGIALLPATVAVLVGAIGVPRGSMLPRWLATLLLVGILPGLFLAHPNTVISLAIIALPMAGALAFGHARTQWSTPGGRRWVLGAVVLTAAVVALGVVVLRNSALVGSVTGYDLPPRDTVWHTIGELLINSPPVRMGAIGVSVLMLIGTVRFVLRPSRRWIAVAYLLVATLDVFANAVDGSFRGWLVGLWYDDSYRLLAVLPVLGVPMAAAGATWIAGRIRAVSPAWIGVSVVGVLIVAFPYLPGSGMDSIESGLTTAYQDTPDNTLSPLISSDEITLLSELDRYVPPGVQLANDPWDGSALAWPIGNRKPLFRHLTGTWDRQRTLLARSLDKAGSDPQVCAAVRDLNVQFLLDFGQVYFPFLPDTHLYPGIDAAPSAPGFELVTRVGDAVLYRITACG